MRKYWIRQYCLKETGISVIVFFQGAMTLCLQLRLILAYQEGVS